MNVARKKILTWDELAREVSRRKREGQRIVFTNGCFDPCMLGMRATSSRHGRWAIA